MIDRRPPAVFVMGPTASGKTALACRLADAFDVDLVSVDSALVYRGLDIGTAKPDAATLARYPHRLIDLRAPDEPYSAADFRADAVREMHAIAATGRIPLLVGGTGLYFRALQHGLSDLPDADAGIRRALADEADAIGWPALHARLATRDPVAAARIRASDTQRIQRALEVIALTGRPLSEQQGARAARLPFRVLKLALMPGERTTLHARIAARFDAMLGAGFLDEVRALRQSGHSSDRPALRAVGYRQAWEHLDGATDAAEFRDRAIAATRQLAKRQITWLRAEIDALALDPERPDLGTVARRAVEAFVGRTPRKAS